MKTTRPIAIGTALLVAVISLASGLARAAEDQKPEAALTEASLIEALRTAAPAEKALACKHLATRGTKAAVPELAKLLPDEQLASWARIALEAIPDPAADEALRYATTTLEGKLLVGTINSIAVRRDAGAVDLLASRLKDQDVEVASAAAVALGSIGNDAATKALRQSLAGLSAPVTNAVAEGCILCAERLLADGRAGEATAIYDEIRRGKVAKPRKLEATRGAILARKAAGVPLLLEQLRSPDRSFYQIGLSTARELPGSEVTSALATELATTSPDRAALLLHVLADRGDSSVLPAVLVAARGENKPLRVAALSVVGKLGNASSLAPLLEVAAETDAEVATAAKAAIVGLSDQQVDAEITSRLDAADGALLVALLELVGQRRITATPLVTKKLQHADAAVRSAALTALGATVAQADLGVLVSQANGPKDPADEPVAQRALRAACLRMPDREACAAELAAAMSQSTAATKVNLLETLGAMGGAKALETIDLAMKSGDASLQDAGSRVLGEWLSVDAAPVLLNLSKIGVDDKYKVRALRGYIRLARQYAMPDPQRAEMCQTAIAASSRAEEQKLALAVLERYPSPDTLKVAVKTRQIAALADEAKRVALAICEKLGDSAAKAREVLAESSAEPVQVEIVKAEYGADAAKQDVTEALRKCVDNSPLVCLPSASYNDSFGGDPASGAAKTLTIEYRLNGKLGSVSLAENALIALPMPK